MKIDTALSSGGLGHLPLELNEVEEVAVKLEQMGYDGLKSIETAHDPFFPLLLAARKTKNIQLMTAIAVAFARSPMVLAHIGHALNTISSGRFILGLGSQLRPHITNRFSMPWSSPARRMREFLLAMHAIWDNWYDKKPLSFKGEFYSHTLMTPFFAPKPSLFGRPKIYLAAVGPRMTEVAGEVADGIILHSFTTPAYIQQTTLPALQKGLDIHGRTRTDIEISCPIFCVTGRDEKELKEAKVKMREQIAFYGSTPAYRPVLKSIGVEALQPKLNGLSKQGEWQKMGELIDDTTLSHFAIIGEPESLAEQIQARFGNIADRVTASYVNLTEKGAKNFISRLRESS